MSLRSAISTFRGNRVPRFNIIGKWRWWFGLSGAIIVISLIALSVRGLNFSIEFKGGSVLQFANRSGASVADYQAIMDRFGLSGSEVELVSGGTGCPTGCINIKSRSLTDLGQVGTASTPTPSPSANASASPSPQASPSASASAQASPSPGASASPAASGSSGLPTLRGDQLRAALAAKAGISTGQINEQDVGPTWGSTISRKAVFGLIVFLILVTIYITFRFEWKMALSALVALGHDLIITAGIYALLGRDVTPETVIAILTILGYSLYDTVVIFDKVKENTEQASLVARDGYAGVVNMSLNQTLMRSVNTSLVVLLPIGSLLVFGGETLKNFAFALFIGVASGTYSSIFVAAPTLALLKEREPRYQEIRRRAAARAARPGLRTTAPRGSLRAVEDGQELEPAASVAAVPAGDGRSARASGSQEGRGPGAQTVGARAATGSAQQARPSSAARKKKGKTQGRPKRRRR